MQCVVLLVATRGQRHHAAGTCLTRLDMFNMFNSAMCFLTRECGESKFMCVRAHAECFLSVSLYSKDKTPAFLKQLFRSD